MIAIIPQFTFAGVASALRPLARPMPYRGRSVQAEL
jgi:hypothetical protein